MIKRGSVLIILVWLTLLPLDCYAHPGNTDSNGGHYDHINGGYHYHHGYPAHDHPNGICPYRVKNNSSSSYSSYSSGTSKVTAKRTATTSKNSIVDIPSEYICIAVIVNIIMIFVFICIIKSKSKKIKDIEENYEYRINKHNNELAQLKQSLEDEYRKLTNTYMTKEKEGLKKERDLLESGKQLLSDVLADKRISNPTMAKVLADYEQYIAERAAYELEHKWYPAIKAAEKVREFGQRNKELKQKIKEAEYIIDYYRTTKQERNGKP